MSRVDAEAGLTPARLSALSVVHFGGPLPLGRLARAEGVSSPTMSRVVDALCELGSPSAGAHDVNGRVTMVAATPSGSALMRRAAARRADVIAAALGGLPARQRDASSAPRPTSRPRRRRPGRGRPQPYRLNSQPTTNEMSFVARWASAGASRLPERSRR